MKALQLKGQKVDRLTVVAMAMKDKWGSYKWWCLCECGEYIIVLGSRLQRKESRSCGCFCREVKKNRSKTHGKYYTPEYRIWAHIKDRCLNKKDKGYKNYGGRGITISKRWLIFTNFLEDMGPRPKGLTIERTNNNLGYSKKNCRWDTYQNQARNKRIQKRSTTGCTGVYLEKRNKRYIAEICTNYKRVRLGAFTNLQDAIAARKSAEIKYWGKNG